MRKIFLVLAVLLLLVMIPAAHAQDDVKLSSVSVNIWPEYDQAAVLVIYHITLAPDTALPATLFLHIPAQAQVNAVAVLDPVSGLLNAENKRTVEGEWALLEITATTLQVQVEYYDALVKDGKSRNIVFEWAGDYALGTIEVNFLEPVDAQNVRVVPPPVESAPNEDGLVNHIIWASDLSAGQPFIVTIDYERESDDLTISSLPVEPVVTPTADAEGRVSLIGTLPWLLAGMGVLLLAAGIFGFVAWQKGDREMPSPRKRHAPRPSKDEETVYCPRCGKRAQSGDAFCRTCGARLGSDDTD